MPIYLCMPTEIQKLHRLPYFCVAASAAAFAAWAAAFWAAMIALLRFVPGVTGMFQVTTVSPAAIAASIATSRRLFL